jgi:uncharacterized membrane protein HdeD (DUF308 family)
MSDLETSFDLGKDFRKMALIGGLFFLVLGGLGIALPQFMSILTASFFGWLLVTAGALVFYINSQGFGGRSALRWLKPFILVAVGLLIVFNPVAGAAGLGLALGVYLMFDGFYSISTAWDLRPLSGWLWMGINGILSFALSFFVLASWPASSMILVGLYVGISLLFDGLALLALRKAV